MSKLPNNPKQKREEKMSWLARSIVNTLRGEEDEDDDHVHNPQSQSQSQSQSPSTDQNPNKPSANRENDRRQDGSDDEDEDPTRGVKEDLSELTKTLTRQFWGVASFLAPPPASGDAPPPDPGQRPYPAGSYEADGDNSPRLGGIRSDFAEIGGKFKSGISMLSSTMAVSEISKIASTFLEFGSEEDDVGESEGEEKYEGGAVGVTEEVLAFARNISMHPETWLDFPLIPDEDDSDEFDISDAQQEHALAVERLAPRLAALRIELCPSHMSESRFWKIYFVLLHSRLNRPNAELLTTPQIVQSRAMLLQDLQSRTKPKSEESARSASSLPKEEDASVPLEHNVIPPSDASALTSSTKTLTVEEPSTSVPITDFETEKHPVETTEVKIVDKSVIEEDLPVKTKTTNFSSDTSSTISIQKFEEEGEDGDDWLEEEETGEASGSRGAAVSLGNDEDVSFSDLEVEEDDDGEGPSKNSKTINNSGDSQQKYSKGCQKNSGAAKSGHSSSPQNEESSDWLNIDDIDDE